MSEISIVGLDLAKHVFQIHGIDDAGQVVVRRQLRRGEVLKVFAKFPRCVVGMEACGSAYYTNGRNARPAVRITAHSIAGRSHPLAWLPRHEARGRACGRPTVERFDRWYYWARQLAAVGHEVRLLPPAMVKPYVKRGKKNDAADAAAICEAVTRPHMRFVPVKSADQQAVLLLHRTRDLLIRQRTMLINALRAHMAEFGVVVGQGTANVAKLVSALDCAETPIPDLARMPLRLIGGQIAETEQRIGLLDKEIVARHQACEASRNLATIPGIGPITASAIAATVPDASAFKSGRQFAAWLGLVPRQNSSGGKDRLGGITKMGDRYIRRLLVIGATAVIGHASRKSARRPTEWLTGLLARKTARVASVALANKMARMAWAILSRGEVYRDMVAARPA